VNVEKILKKFKTHTVDVPWITISLFARLYFAMTMGKTAAALPHHRGRSFLACCRKFIHVSE
jgi:hypothetical protein